MIKSVLIDDGLVVESHNAALIAEPWQLQTQEGKPYRVFTPFWRNLAQRLELAPKVPWDCGLGATWSPGEIAAHDLLGDFLDEVSNYAIARDRPDLPGTSMLSPHLHFGEISPRQILATLRRAARDQRGFEERVEPFLRELGWREFAHHLLFHYPTSATENLNPRFDAFPWAEVDHDQLRAWQRGVTGLPIVDAGMRELWQTGWMHNRVRMIVASLLTKNLRFHWLHGAHWFWDTLVDADLAANTLGCRASDSILPVLTSSVTSRNWHACLRPSCIGRGNCVQSSRKRSVSAASMLSRASISPQAALPRCLPTHPRRPVDSR